MIVSVITTVKNGEREISELVENLLRQTKTAAEIMICDGGSKDHTWQLLKKYALEHKNLRVLQKPGGISVGRNAAIKAANSEVIAVTDSGCRPAENWLEEITKPFTNSDVSAVAGFFKADPKNIFEKISSTLMLSDHDKINPETWLPSSRSIAFRKEVWEKVGGYPENLPFAGEDTLFDLNIKKAGYKFFFAEKALVYWRPRKDIVGFFKQYFNYALGDGQALTNTGSYIKKSLIYFFGLFLLLLMLVNSFFWAPLLIGFLLYIWKRGYRVFKKIPRIETVFLLPVLIITDDLAEILGFLKGVLSSGKN